MSVSPLFRFIVQVGVPAAIALYLTWRLSGNQDRALSVMSDRLTEHMNAQTAMQATLQEQVTNQRDLIKILIQTCQNAAHGEYQDLMKTKCWPDGGTK